MCILKADEQLGGSLVPGFLGGGECRGGQEELIPQEHIGDRRQRWDIVEVAAPRILSTYLKR